MMPHTSTSPHSISGPPVGAPTLAATAKEATGFRCPWTNARARPAELRKNKLVARTLFGGGHRY